MAVVYRVMAVRRAVLRDLLDERKFLFASPPYGEILHNRVIWLHAPHLQTFPETSGVMSPLMMKIIQSFHLSNGSGR